MIYRAALLLAHTRDTPDEALGAALSGLDTHSASAQRVGPDAVSIVLTFDAASDAEALRLARDAARSAARGSSVASAHIESLSVGRGRSHRKVALR